ncbi:MAG: hypothetical protein ABR591_15650 [Candidatus Velthaea sp.]
MNGRAIVVVGRSGVGKTTLVLQLVARGARLYSDECLFVEKETMLVTGLPCSHMIREPSLKLAAWPPPATERRVKRWKADAYGTRSMREPA